jgi:hypothetical protein
MTSLYLNNLNLRFAVLKVNGGPTLGILYYNVNLRLEVVAAGAAGRGTI